MSKKRRIFSSLLFLLCICIGKEVVGQQIFEKSFFLRFENNKPNQVAYINFPRGIPMWGYFEVEITGGYNSQLNQGVLRKRIEIVFNGNSDHYLSQEGHVDIASEPLANQWYIGDFDKSTFQIPIYHLVPTGNTISVNLRVNLVQSDNVIQIKDGTTITLPQEVTGLSIKRPYRNFKDSRIGIGTDTPQSRLDVNGDIRAREIKVETANWPDFVFQSDYELKPLSEVSKFIKENGHLPEVPKASVVEEEGVSLGEMNKILLKKVEELTLHLIENQEKRINLENEVLELKQLVNKIQNNDKDF